MLRDYGLGLVLGFVISGLAIARGCPIFFTPAHLEMWNESLVSH